MKIVKLYKEVKGEIISCNAQEEQLETMSKAGWSDEKPESKEVKKTEQKANKPK